MQKRILWTLLTSFRIWSITFFDEKRGDLLKNSVVEHRLRLKVSSQCLKRDDSWLNINDLIKTEVLRLHSMENSAVKNVIFESSERSLTLWKIVLFFFFRQTWMDFVIWQKFSNQIQCERNDFLKKDNFWFFSTNRKRNSALIDRLKCLNLPLNYIDNTTRSNVDRILLFIESVDVPR